MHEVSGRGLLVGCDGGGVGPPRPQRHPGVACLLTEATRVGEEDLSLLLSLSRGHFLLDVVVVFDDVEEEDESERVAR